MKRLFSFLAVCAAGATLMLPMAAKALTHDEGGFRWSYSIDESEDAKGSYVASISQVEQLDAAGKPTDWTATSLQVPATLPATWTNEFAQAERVYDENGNFLSNKYTTVYGPEVKSVVATVESCYFSGTGYWTSYYDEEKGYWTSKLVRPKATLQSIAYPDSVEYIGGDFSICSNLTTVTMGPDGDFSAWTFAETPWLKAQGEFVIRDGTLIAYQGKETAVVVPAGVDRIGSGAFSAWYNEDMTNLVSVTLPAGLEEIGDEAFAGCEKLAGIDIPAKVTSIGDWAFEDCYGLTSVTVPSKVKRLYDGVFAGCTNLVSVTLPVSLKSIGYEAFAGSSALASIAIPASVKWIDADAFYRCTALTTVDIPPSVEEIYDEAFEDCTNLATVTGGTGVKSLGWDVFNNTKLWNDVEKGIVQAGPFVVGYKDDGTLPDALTIPDGVTLIVWDAFYGKSSVKTLNLPSSLKVIGGSAFEDCTNLETVTGGDNVEELRNDSVFYNTPYWKTFWKDRGNKDVPFGLVRLGKVVLGYTGVCPAEVVIPDDVTSIYNCLFSGAQGETWSDTTESTTNITSVTIGSRVKQIDYWAFNQLPNLKTVMISGPLEELNNEVFGECTSLTDVTLTGSNLDLTYDPFYDCTNLVNVTINLVEPEEDDEDDPRLSIDSYTFATCDKLASVKVTRSGYQLTGWTTWGYMEEEIKFADEINTFHLWKVRRAGENAYYNYTTFRPAWKRILRNAENDTPFNSAVASTYIGWLTNPDGNLIGTVTVKVQKKGRNGPSKATAVVTVIGGKKVTLKGTIDDSGNGQGALAGLKLTGNGLAGTLAVNGVAYTADGARDVTKTSKDPEQNVFKTLNKKVWTLVLAPEDENPPLFANGFTGFSVSMGTKGKAKLAGVLPDGTKIAVNSQTVVGEYNCCIPFVFSKTKSSFGFLVWVDRAGAALDVTAISEWKGKVTGSGAFATKMELVDFQALKEIPASTMFGMDPADLPATLVGVQQDRLPVAEPVTVAPRKWTLAKPATIKFKKGVFDQVAYDKGIAGGKTNNSSLKLKYASKTGLFTGSFYIYTVQGAKMKKVTANVSGTVCDGVGYGSALIKKVGTIPVWIGEIDEDDED